MINKKNILLFIYLGLTYVLIEFIYRFIFFPHSITIIQSISMFFIGGICTYHIGLINEYKHKFKMYQQCIIATVFILIVELISGLILNCLLNLNIWNYNRLPLNICGQISLLFAFIWLLLTPFAFWLDDTYRNKIDSNEEIPYKLTTYYKNLFLLK